MSGFLFQTTRSIMCEIGAARKTGTIMQNLGCRHVMVVTDRGIVGAGLLDRVTQSLEAAGIRASVFDAVEADPSQEMVLEAAHSAKSQKCDGVLGLGGGSPMDVAKLVSLLNGPGCSQTLDEMYGVHNAKGGRLPMIQVPTTAGTGSEVTPIAIITTGKNTKKGVVSPTLYPDWAVLDGELTLTVPPHVTAATGIDAMVHALEAYTSATKKNPLSDLLGLEALRLLSSNIHRAVQHGDDAKARGEMLLGSMYAGMAFANAPVGAVHALAYPIGSHFHVPHGLSNSLVLPAVLRFNNGDAQARSLYAQMAPIIFPTLAKGGEPDGEMLAAGFEQLAADLGIQTRLSQVGITEADVKLLVTEGMKQERLLPNNMRKVTASDAEGVYRSVL